MSLRDIAGVALLTISLILGAVVFSNGVRYYRNKHHDETLYLKRRGNIVIFYTACSIIGLVVAFPIFFLGSGRYLFHKYEDTPLFRALCTVHYVLFFSSLNLGTFIFFGRYWLISYDIKLADSSSSIEWKTYITQNMAAIKKEMWYIRHRAIFGNARYVFAIALLIAIPLSSLMIVDNALWNYGIYSYENISWIVGGSIYLCALLAFFKVWWSTPYINDNICLYEEFRTITCVLSVAWLMWLLSVVLSFIWPGVLALMTVQLAIQITMFSKPFISTFFVLRQIDTDGTSADEQLPDMMEAALQLHPVLPFEQILSSELSLNAFMAHLIKEFSIESLLSLIEFCQFRNYGMESFHIEAASLAQIEIDWPVHAKLPLSDIVHANAQSEIAGEFASYKHKAHALYVKYIVKDADFEINISYRLKQKLHRLMDDYDVWMSAQNTMRKEVVIMMFDECIASMLQLLRASKHRFKFEQASPKSMLKDQSSNN